MKSLNLAYNPRIDQLRWLAATIVFLYHFHLEYRMQGAPGLSDPWFGIVTEGHTGVGLFFALSGFLFMQIALGQRQIVYRDFIRNRFLRIFPLFLAVFLLATSIGRDKFQPQDLLYLAATNLGMAPTSNTVVTGAAWTISLEFLFYLVFPFLARATMERGARYLFGLLGMMVFFKLAAFTVNANSTLMFFSTFVGRFDQFLVGMLAALAWRDHADAIRKAARVLLPLSLALVVSNSALQARYAPIFPGARSEFWIFWSLMESTAWSLVIVSWLALPARLPAVLERVLCHGGKISFSFYLLHMGVLHVLAQRVGLADITGVPKVDIVILLAGAYAATWAVATLSYYTIEEPFLQMRREYGAKKSVVQLAPAA